MTVQKFDLCDITALVLAGGRGSRMGAVDKGLEAFHDQPLVQHALQRLGLQSGGPLHSVIINANRNATDYANLGDRVVGVGKTAVLPDTLENFAGPLAGFLVGLAHCSTAFLLTVPCDSPLLPLDLAQRLFCALVEEDADIAMVSAPDAQLDVDELARSGGAVHKTASARRQPVFCLLKTALHTSLSQYLSEGGRKIDGWAVRHRLVLVPFDAPGDDPRAFANANTLAQLRALELHTKRPGALWPLSNC